MPVTATLKQLLAELHAERAASWPASDLQVNVDQRAELVATFDPSRAVQPGDRLEPYVLEDVRGGTIALDELVADGPAVLVFFRFAGCPACNVALPYYRDRLAPGLDELGARLVAVSPQLPERLVEIADRHDLPFTVATDRGNELARRLGITFTSNEASQAYARSKGADMPGLIGTGTWELPMPAVLVLGRNRIVQLVDVTPDWMARSDAEPVLAAVRELSLAHACR
jgi:peroxiredoxin